MASSNQNGNRQHFLLYILLVLILAGLFFYIIQLMLFDGVRSGKYKDPQLASKVVSGTIYEKEGKALAISIPSYDLVFDTGKISNLYESCRIASQFTDSSISVLLRKCQSVESGSVTVLETIPQSSLASLLEELGKINPSDSFKIQKNTKRTYPSGNHAGDLVLQVEQIMGFTLNPRPGFNETITYGKSIQLTIVNEIQYLLDLALNDMYEAKHFDYYGLILDYETGAILGMSSTPFTDPSISKDYNSLPYISELKFDDSEKTINPYFIEGINNPKESGFITAEEEIKNILSGKYGSYNISRFPSREDPKYVLLICCSSYITDYNYENIAYQIFNGLSAQGRL